MDLGDNGPVSGITNENGHVVDDASECCPLEEGFLGALAWLQDHQMGHLVNKGCQEESRHDLVAGLGLPQPLHLLVRDLVTLVEIAEDGILAM